MENSIFNTKMKNFHHDTREMTIFVEALRQKEAKFHSDCHNFWNTCPKSIKIVFSDSSLRAFKINKSCT